jgi:hypothetical protein
MSKEQKFDEMFDIISIQKEFYNKLDGLETLRKALY